MYAVDRPLHHLGSIPACAGEPVRRLVLAIWNRGLSPRVRGSPPMRCACSRNKQKVYPRVCGGAGKRSSVPIFPSLYEVYPRVCGGATIRTLVNGLCVGLSPRVRGSLPSDRRLVRMALGLSPRVRGSPGRGLGRPRTSNGSIPACAGEPVGREGRTSNKSGLSPRVRGSPSRPRQIFTFGILGSIPACAGEPSCRHGFPPTGVARSIPACAGSPLSRPTVKFDGLGLSPRVRGSRVIGLL